MWKLKFCIVTLCVASSFARPQNQDAQNSLEEEQLSKVSFYDFEITKDIEISKFHVNTDIQMRYAVTKVETLMKNPNSESKDVSFNMYIPDEAFASDFSMRINDQTYTAKVLKKEQAKQKYEESESNTGLLFNNKVDFKDTNHIAFSAKIDPYGKVIFQLKYEEQLKRKNGKYTYKLNLQLEDQEIQDFKIKINITETLPLDENSINVRRESNEIYKLSSEDLLANTTKIPDMPNHALIEYTEKDYEGQDWIFNVDYEVKRPNDGNDVQIGAGKFVHYFSPENLPTLTKHFIFVIDVSGSMSGRPIRQTKDALIMIFEELNAEDSFDIITFSEEAKIWQPSYETLEKCINYENKLDAIRMEAELFGNIINLTQFNEKLGKDCHLTAAQKKVFDLEASGGTNINDALLKAIELAGNDTHAEKEVEKMIIFLTDGEATSGETNNDKIKENVQQANIEIRVPIFGLAFGNGADFNLIKDISDQSGAFAKRIYEAGTSFEQLENFSHEISDPKLRNVNFQYFANGQLISPEFLSTTKIENAFGNEEYVVTGVFEDPNIQLEKFEVRTAGKNSQGNYNEDLVYTPCEPIVDDYDLEETNCLWVRRSLNSRVTHVRKLWQQTPAEEFMERFWAFKRIKSLFSRSQNDDEDCQGPLLDDYNDYESDLDQASDLCYEKAVSLALKYQFVTKATSLVVESNDAYLPNNTKIIDDDTVYTPKISNEYVTTKYGQKVHYNDYYDYAEDFASLHVNTGQSYGSYGGGGGGYGSQNYDYYPDYDQDYQNQTQTTITTTTTTTTTTPYFPCKIILYSKTHFRGDLVEIDNDIDTLGLKNFDDKLASVDVEGNCCWDIYTDENFSGQSMNFNRSGRFPSAVDLRIIFQKASSVKRC